MRHILTVWMLGLSLALCAQDTITLSSQAQVDSFRIVYGTVDSLSLLVLSGDIEQVDSLLDIVYIEGLRINTTQRRFDCSGMTGWASAGRIDVAGVSDSLRLPDQLKTVDWLWLKFFAGTYLDLNNVESLRRLNIWECQRLEVITGAVPTRMAVIELLDVPSIQRFDALDAAQDSIERLSVLFVHHDGATLFPSLTHVDRLLMRFDSSRYTSLFGALSSVGSLLLGEMPMSAAESGFGVGLEEVRELVVSGSMQAALPVLPDMDVALLERIAIANNTALTRCTQPWLCAFIADKGMDSLVYSDNGPCLIDDLADRCIVSTHDAEQDAVPLTVYPNPTAGLVHLAAGSHTIEEVRVYEQLGRQVAVSYEAGSLNLCHTLPGHYVVMALIDGQWSSMSVLRQ